MNRFIEAKVELKEPPIDSRILILEIEKELQKQLNDDTIEVKEIGRYGTFKYVLEITSENVELKRGKVKEIIQDKLNELYAPKVESSSNLSIDDVKEIK